MIESLKEGDTICVCFPKNCRINNQLMHTRYYKLHVWHIKNFISNEITIIRSKVVLYEKVKHYNVMPKIKIEDGSLTISLAIWE